MTYIVISEIYLNVPANAGHSDIQDLWMCQVHIVSDHCGNKLCLSIIISSVIGAKRRVF